MEKKLKKQRKKLIIKISAILIAVWLILSCAYSIVAFYDEKEREYNDARIAFSSWQKNMEPYNLNPMMFIDDARVTAVANSNPDNELITDISYVYNHNINLVIEESQGKQKYNSDDFINICFTNETQNPEYREEHYGYMSYSRFRKSMTDEQYQKILYYLDNQPEGMYYYELICTDFYQKNDEQNKYDESIPHDYGELIPKTVQIVLTRDVHKWHVQDEEVEAFELNPTGVEGLTLYHISYLDRNEFPEEFIRHTFGSNNLMATAQTLVKEMVVEKEGIQINNHIELLQVNVGLLQVNAFEYIYYGFNSVTTKVIEFSYDTMEYEEGNTPATVYYTNDGAYDVYYAQRMNILEGCITNILTATGILFLFFMIIGTILTIMLWRILKTQMLEEQKRRNMTNALAHDIKTPLFILSGYAGNLKENVHTDKREHYAEVIVEQTEEVNQRVNRMLELSKLDSPSQKLNLQEFDLAELAREILSNYEALPDGKTISFTVNTKNLDGKVSVNADRDLMKRAIENLIDNAVKYADVSTEIKITVTSHAFEISNTCSAIEKTDLTSLMNHYSRTAKIRSDDSSAHGSGLGLSIAKSILDLHKFKLSYDIEHEVVTFRITAYNIK